MAGYLGFGVQDTYIFFLFLIIMVIIMSNLLIAVICDSYALAMEEADTLIWKASLVSLNKGNVMMNTAVSCVRNIVAAYRHQFGKSDTIEDTPTRKSPMKDKVLSMLNSSLRSCHDVFDEEVEKMEKKDPAIIRIRNVSKQIEELKQKLQEIQDVEFHSVSDARNTTLF